MEADEEGTLERPEGATADQCSDQKICHTGEGRCPWHTWVPAFAGKTRKERLMKIAPIFAAAFWLCSTAAAPVLADGGGGDDRSPAPTCGRGEVWDSRSRRCVKAENGILPDKALAENAFALAKLNDISKRSRS